MENHSLVCLLLLTIIWCGKIVSYVKEFRCIWWITCFEDCTAAAAVSNSSRTREHKTHHQLFYFKSCWTGWRNFFLPKLHFLECYFWHRFVQRTDNVLGLLFQSEKVICLLSSVVFCLLNLSPKFCTVSQLKHGETKHQCDNSPTQKNNSEEKPNPEEEIQSDSCFWQGRPVFCVDVEMWSLCKCASVPPYTSGKKKCISVGKTRGKIEFLKNVGILQNDTLLSHLYIYNLGFGGFQVEGGLQLPHLLGGFNVNQEDNGSEM